MHSPTPSTPSTIIPALRYRDAPAAIEWFCSVLGFERKGVYLGLDGTVAHAELTLGGGMIMLGSAKEDEHAERFRSPHDLNGTETRGVYIVVVNSDVVHARAVAAGADVIKPLHNTDYGSREFAVRDPEGHTWSLGTYNPWTV